MTTTADLINEAKRYLYSMQREEMNILTAGFTSVASPTLQTLTFTYPQMGIRSGAYLAIDLEIFYVFAASATTVTVVGGQLGSTPATHASGAIVTVNPKFPDFNIFYALNQEIVSLSSPDNGLFQIKDVDLVYNPAKQGYDLAGVTDLIDIQSIRYKQANASNYEPSIRSFGLTRNQNTTDYSSGYTLSLYEAAWPGQTIRVHYKAPFSSLVNLTDDVVVVTGLPKTATDIPALGAAVRLMAGRELKRNFTEAQDEPKRGQEIPAGAVANSVKNLMMLWQRRVNEELARLEAAYPQISNRA